MAQVRTLAAQLLALLALVSSGCAQTKPGGYFKATVTNASVREAAAVAIATQARSLPSQTNGQPARLELVRILDADQQVVAGMNYRLKLLVRLDGQERKAEATVWCQAWRKPDPCELTEWTWAPAPAPRP